MTVLAVLAMAFPSPRANAVVALTGEVRAIDSQILYVPQSNFSPTVIRYFVPEGQAVKRGQVVLRIDPGQSASMLPDLEAQIEQADAKAAKELSALEVKALEAEQSAAEADAKLATAKIDAAIPRDLASRLDYDRYQGELKRATEEALLKRSDAAKARVAIVRRRQDATLEMRKLVVQRDYHAALVRTAEIRAERDGIVVHGFNNNWLGGRIDEGSSAMSGAKAGEIVSGGGTQVRAWALEADRGSLEIGQAVRLTFDALPGRAMDGRIASISGAPESRPEWSRGRYFVVDIDLPNSRSGAGFLPGMSVRVIAPLTTREASR